MNLTVIIPVKNEIHNVRNLINNIDYYRNSIKFLFVDAYSDDGSFELLIDANFQVIRQEPQGIYSAFNLGIQNINTKYCMFLGSDDSLLPDILKLSIELDKVQFCMLVCQSIILPINEITNHRIDDFNLINKNFCHQSIIYNAGYIKTVYFEPRHNIMGDWLLNLKLYSKHSKIIYFKEYVISTYKQGGFSGSNIDLLWERKHYFYKLRYLKFSNIIKFIFNRWVSVI